MQLEELLKFDLSRRRAKKLNPRFRGVFRHIWDGFIEYIEYHITGDPPPIDQTGLLDFDINFDIE